MRTHVLPSALVLALGGCLHPVASEEELAADGDESPLASRLMPVLDPSSPFYAAYIQGGPFPYYAMDYVEQGETVPEGFDVAAAWGDRSVARSPDGRELYVLHGGMPLARFLVLGDLPEHARAHVIFGMEGYEEWGLALVDEEAATAGLLTGSSHGEPESIPIARGPDGTVGAPGLDETVALRWLRTCPGLLEQCALYGAPADVEAAVDPIAPVGDWFLHPRNATLAPPDGARFEEVASYDGDGGGLLIVTRAAAGIGPYEEPQWFYRAWLELDGRRVHAFDFIADDYLEWAIGRVALDGDRLIVSHWWPEDMSASFSEHDARTGERIGEPITLAAEMYFEPECSAGVTSTRPMPVRTDNHLSFALWWGESRVLLFDGRSSYGRWAGLEVDESVDESAGEDDYYWVDTQAADIPAVLQLAP